MVCLKTWKDKKYNDFKTLQGWLDFVNSNDKYAKHKSTPLDWEGKCRECDIPSYHPYWDYKRLRAKPAEKIVPPHKVIELKRSDIEVPDYMLCLLNFAEAITERQGEVLASEYWITWRLEEGAPVPYGTVKCEKLRMVPEDRVTDNDVVVKIMSVIID